MGYVLKLGSSKIVPSLGMIHVSNVSCCMTGNNYTLLGAYCDFGSNPKNPVCIGGRFFIDF